MKFLVIFSIARDTFNIVSKLKEFNIVPHQYMKNTIVFETNEEIANVSSWMEDLYSSINKRGNIQIYQFTNFFGFTDSILDTRFQKAYMSKKDQ